MLITESLAINARTAPHADAYVFRSHDGIEQRLSWGELWDRTRHLARGVAAIVEPGERVMLIFDPGLEFIETFFAVQIAGSVPVPMSGRFGPRSVERVQGAIASDIVTTVVSDRACCDFVRRSVAGRPLIQVTTHEDLRALGDTDRALPRPAEDAFVQFSSGSTGTPHGIVIAHRNLSRNLSLMAELCEARTGEVSLSWLPAHHDFGLIGGILFPAFLGGTGILMPPSSFVRRPRTWLELIARHRVAVTGAPNFGYELATKRVSDVSGLDLSSLRVAINGAERVQADTLRHFERRFAPAGLGAGVLRPCYGLAEATLLVSGAADGGWKSRAFKRDMLLRNRLVGADEVEDDDVVELVSNGRPVIDGLIVENDGLAVVPGEVGEILINDPSVSRSAETRLVSSKDEQREWASTGDLGALLDGQLYIVGRIKDMVIRDGINIHLEEVEGVIEQLVLPGRLQAICAFRVAGSEELGVVIEDTRPASLPPTVEDDVRRAIMKHFGVKLAEMRVVLSGGIPRTTSGKKQRFAVAVVERDIAQAPGVT